MDQIGSEIGQKMRCAVKAKLSELEAGYIDEELPDYVMILLVNKKSKESMEEALGLFLGEHTTTFVEWLLDVLAKLQEVTVPRKRKTSESEPAAMKKKDKRKKPITVEDETVTLPSINLDITEVIKEGFIQRARKDLETQVNVKKKDDFDIPTITDIAKEAKEKKQEENMAQLEEIQKKIYIAKKQLQSMVSDAEENEEDEGIKTPPPPPIIISKSPARLRTKIHINPQFLRRNEKISPKPPTQSFVESRKPNQEFTSDKVIKLSAIRRAEREIYVPKQRRGEIKRNSHDDKRYRSRSPDLRTKRINNNNNNDRRSDLRQNLNMRKVSSRVTKMPSKPVSDEETLDVSRVSSVIRIQPRPKVPKNKQANKMLLLRAMADAQKSTTNRLTRVQTKTEAPRDLREKIVVQIPHEDEVSDEIDMTYDDIEADIIQEEYVPEPITRTSESESDVYVPRRSQKNDDEYDPRVQPKTQFVVTLKGAKQRLGIVKQSPAREIKSKRPVKERIGYKFHLDEDDETKRKRKERFDRGYERRDTRQVSPSPPPAPIITHESESSGDSRPPSAQNIIHSKIKELQILDEKRSITPPVRRDRARTISPINFDLTDEETRSRSSDGDSDFESRINKENLQRKSTIKKLESTKKFDNIPQLLSTVTIPMDEGKKQKSKCIFFPNCTMENCEFHHPSLPCIAFPACKFGDKCLFLHPKCRFDLGCTKPECNYTHSVPTVISVKGSAMPLASSVVPVQNYKSLSLTPLPALCKFYPNCTNGGCHFYHPKPCKFGKLCNNKIECNFYHNVDNLPTKDKLRWLAPTV